MYFFHVLLMKLASDVWGLVGEDSGVSLNHDQAVAALVPASYFLFLSFFLLFQVCDPPAVVATVLLSTFYLSTFLSDLLSP